MNLEEFVKKNPRKIRQATDKMISYAEKIADALELPCPNFNDFDDTSKFISRNVEAYKDWCTTPDPYYDPDLPF